MKITQHIPNFVDYEGERPSAEFKNLDEFIEIPFVKEWIWKMPSKHKLIYTNPSTGERREEFVENNDTFSHFALDGNTLIAVLNKGEKWWVVGYIDDPSSLDFPAWKPKQE